MDTQQETAADFPGEADAWEGFGLMPDEEPGAEDAPLDEDDGMHLWPGDTGSLPLEARTALLKLVRGPYISESADGAQWRALLNYTESIRSRLADLFLELCIDADAGVAFARNISVEGKDFPKAATSYTMTLLDTIMVLLLRRELQTAGASRAFIGQADLFAQMGNYRPTKMDQAAYLKRLETSWSRLVKQRLLVRSDVEGRFEISPVLKLVFGAEEAAAVYEEYQRLREAEAEPEPEAPTVEEEGTLFDGLE